MDTPSSTTRKQYWCHECQARTRPYVREEDEELCCSTCSSSFVEEMEDDGSLFAQQQEPQQNDEEFGDEWLNNNLNNFMRSMNPQTTTTTTTTTSSGDQTGDAIPTPSPNLNPFVQNLFNGYRQQQQQQQQRQGPTSLTDIINQMMGSFMNAGNNSNGVNNFAFNFGDIFSGMDAQFSNNGQFGDYFLGDNLDAIINRLIDHNGRVGTPPTSKRAMENLPIAKATEDDAQKECTICQENYKSGEEIVTLPCKHVFHKECLWPWLLRHSTCPTCRHQLENTDASPNPDATNSGSDNNTSSNNNNSEQPSNSNNNNNNGRRMHTMRFNLQDLFGFPGPANNNNNNNNNSRRDGSSSSGGGNMSYFL